MLCRLGVLVGVRGGGGAESSVDKSTSGQGKQGANANGGDGGVSPRTQAEQVRTAQSMVGDRDAVNYFLGYKYGLGLRFGTRYVRVVTAVRRSVNRPLTEAVSSYLGSRLGNEERAYSTVRHESLHVKCGGTGEYPLWEQSHYCLKRFERSGTSQGIRCPNVFVTR